jgi:hypothetical protein
MAYDKVVDSAALDGALTGIANAIRGKTGSTEKLTLDGMAAAITGIQTGSGSGDSSGAKGVYVAQVTPAENVGTITVEHNLGTTDIALAALWVESFGEVVPNISGGLFKCWAKTNIHNRRGGVGFQALSTYDVTNARASDMAMPNSEVYWDEAKDENNFTFVRPGSASAQYIGGVTYTVVIVAANAEV